MDNNSSLSRQPWWLAGIIAAVVAAVANVIVHGVARALDTIPQDVLVDSPTGEEPITLAPVIIFTAVPILIAAVLFAILRRTMRQPVRMLWIIGLVALVLSFVTPLTVPDAPARMIITLELMHIVAALVGLGVFTRLIRS